MVEIGPSSPRPRRILGFEPFDSGSHRAVRESIERHSRHRWMWLTRPGRAWKWRMRLAAVEMFEQAQRAGVLDAPFDAVFATSLMSLSDLRALMARAGRGGVPFILYLHENQAIYPTRDDAPGPDNWDANYALTNLSSILAADRVIFNSAWNRDSFIEGIEALLRRAPDLELHDIASRLRSIAQVIWPPVEPPDMSAQGGSATGEWRTRRAANDGAIRIVWPHRWEHDKGPDALLDIARHHAESLNLRFIILGQRFRDVPPAMIKLQQRFADRIDHCGFVDDRCEYWQWLSRADWVLSTARHEFFGIAVVEALLAGCLPWLPDRLSYREILPDATRNLSPVTPPRDPEAVREAIRAHLAPARAEESVRRLDRVIEETIN